MSVLSVIGVPFDSGRRGAGTGAGPLALLSEPGPGGHAAHPFADVELGWISDPGGHGPELARQFEISRQLSLRARRAVESGRRPLVVAGNCNACLGVLGALAGTDPGVVWLDAHGDFNTPETSVSGCFDGMALATATGGCWRALRSSIPGFRPVPERRVVLAGVRDLDPGERGRLAQSELRVVPASATSAIPAALDELAAGTGEVYLHIDLDVLDPAEGVANFHAAPGGLSLEQLDEIVGATASRFRIGAAAVTAYDPEADGDGRVRDAAGWLLRRVAGALTGDA